MQYTKPKGTLDFFGKSASDFRYLEHQIREICDTFNIEEIRTPIFEHTELFERGVGETTDIVQKEMFSFTDRGGRGITLRPEGTAGTVRAYIENKLYAQKQPTKLFYIAPNFRAENPQKGRYRQHHQFGVEVFGSYSPAAEAELISVAYTLLKRLGIDSAELKINSLGCKDCRTHYNETLKKYIGDNINSLCPTCKERFVKNPLRVLDCKSDGCKKVLSEAPSVLDSLDSECTAHFQEFQDYLTVMGIPFTVDPKIVRGLDYYTRTVFEFVSDDLGAQSTVCAGGRYDGLVEELGGTATGAAGFGMGLERLMLILDEQKKLPEYKPGIDIFIGAMNTEAQKTAILITHRLRSEGISAEFDPLGRSVKAQFKYADKINASFAMMLGETEITTSKAELKNMKIKDSAVEVSIADTAEISSIIRKYLYNGNKPC